MLGRNAIGRGITDSVAIGRPRRVSFGRCACGGLNAAFSVSHFGVINFTAANGGDANGSGWLSGAGFEHRGGTVSFVANSLWATRDFSSRVGEPFDPSLRMRQRSLLQTGVSFWAASDPSRFICAGNLSVAAQQQTLGVDTKHRSQPSRCPKSQSLEPVRQRSRTAVLGFYQRVSDLRVASGAAPRGHAFGGRWQRRWCAGQRSRRFARHEPARGAGQRLSPERIDCRQLRYPTGASNFTVLILGASHNAGIDGRSAYLGAMTLLVGQVDTTRTVNGSFAMVDVAGLADVPVYVENQLTTHTDANGKALLFNLRPCRPIASASRRKTYTARHGHCRQHDHGAPISGGVIARFPVERVPSGTFRLVSEDSHAARGCHGENKGVLFPVVLDGLVYVTGYDHGMSAEASWPGGRCSFRLQPPPSDDPLPDMGTIQCRAVSGATGEQPANTLRILVLKRHSTCAPQAWTATTVNCTASAGDWRSAFTIRS